MKSIVLNRELEDKIEIVDLEIPFLEEDEVLVKIKAAALNHRDEWCRQGLYPGLKNGVVLGSDGAGIVEKIGKSVKTSWIGQEVIINPSNNWGEDPRAQAKEFSILGMPENGTLAEFVKVKLGRVHTKPEHLSWEEAAALPLGGLTAFRALMVQGTLSRGQKVLVTGFGGGVAQFAAQFAISGGAEVYVSSSSEEKIKVAKSLGAIDGFNYTNEAWVTEVLEKTEGFDLIIDSAMGNTLNKLIKVARPGGKIVFYGATQGNPSEVDARKIFWNQLHLIGSTMGSDEDFQAMLKFVEENKIKPVLDQIFQPEEAKLAFDKMKLGKQLGKIVIKFS
ncbi:Zn-dependent oxidoreductase, NADPH:quinone reductase [Belliella baltica DSM 15883]|uniref:Zn-dependent oxidoreductase, NADPH:quinone reductase n=1 Tax=Belliella baltica (strain DSM 15883 / CIP 108006 / LMG 21964 / BA134) TaxID=866536 RepID=I3Z6Y7_BELBD|nr:zinc-binding dehydrogenase [Belliella baltica]AFL85005.1 Zn-dependent oxidoreductase, NADPH:quinone reductase [Belliella baltica DSM 15883]